VLLVHVFGAVPWLVISGDPHSQVSVDIVESFPCELVDSVVDSIYLLDEVVVKLLMNLL
jgi:hypothetical protein